MSCNCKRTRPTRVLVPAIVLALVPKCPLCIVAYASSLGVGMTLSTATTLRHVVIALCVIALVFAIVRFVRTRI